MTDTIQPDTRTLVRRIADEMTARQEIPTAEKVRKAIAVVTRGALNPSTSTVQDEMKKWFGDTFWPTHHALGTLPPQDGVPAELQRVYMEGFQRLVIDVMALAKTSWNADRDEFQRQLDERMNEIANLTASKDDLKIEFDRVDQDRITLRLALEKSEATQTELTGQISILQAALAQARSELQAMTQKQLEHERELAQVSNAERARADSAIQQARSEVNQFKVEIDTQRQASKKLEASIEKLQAAAGATTQRATKAETLLEAAQAENGSLRQQVEQLNKLVAKLSESKAPVAERPAPAQKRKLSAAVPTLRKIRRKKLQK